MASAAHTVPHPVSVARPERIDRLLSIGAVILFGAAVAAVVRGHDQWRMVPSPHLGSPDDHSCRNRTDPGHAVTRAGRSATSDYRQGLDHRYAGNRDHFAVYPCIRAGALQCHPPAVVLDTFPSAVDLVDGSPPQYYPTPPRRAWHGARRLARCRLLYVSVPSAARQLAVRLIATRFAAPGTRLPR